MCVKVRARVGGEGKLQAHQPLGSFHSRWTSEMSEEYYTRATALLHAGRALPRQDERRPHQKKCCNLGSRSDD